MALASLREEPDLEDLASDGTSGFDWYYQCNLNGQPRFPEERQYRKLALDYIRLGHAGRKPYVVRAGQSPWRNFKSVPSRRCAKKQGLKLLPRVPVSLYTNRERRCCQQNRNSGSESLFFRTWFGDKEHSVAESDGLYEKFILGWKDAWEDVGRFIIDQEYCFTDISYADVPCAPMRSEAYSLEQWLLSRLPDQLNIQRLEDDQGHQYTEAEFDEEEMICLVIADREAIINGWILLSSINHKGCALGSWRLPAGSLASELLRTRKAIPDYMADAIYFRGFPWLVEPAPPTVPLGGFEFAVSSPPGLWWLAIDRRGFTCERPSEKAPLQYPQS
ncbi:hypothetical protein TWF281_003087 [Arthrobotrys megalospora]